MKGMQKISRGSGFAGVISYALLGENKEVGHGVLIGGTMHCDSIQSMAREFHAVASLRSDIQKPVWHSSLRLPDGETLDNERLAAIADDYMKGMGWDVDRSQYAVFMHDQGGHIHIVANRVSIDSTIHLGRNENLESTRVIGELEISHNLTRTKQREFDGRGKIVMPGLSSLTKNEIDEAARTGIKPVKLVMQDILVKAKEGKPTMSVFLERLDAAGMVSVPNIASGNMQGFSFRYAGKSKKASELGSDFKWNTLSKGLDYEQARDGKELAERRRAAIATAADAKLGTVIDGDRSPAGGADNTVDFDARGAARRGFDGGKAGPGTDAVERDHHDVKRPLDQRISAHAGRPSEDAGAEALIFGLDDAPDAPGGAADGRRGHVHVESTGASVDTRPTRSGGTAAAGEGVAAVHIAKAPIEDYQANFRSPGMVILSEGETTGQRLQRGFAERAAAAEKEHQRLTGLSNDEGPGR